MEVFGRERLDVHLLQGPPVDLPPRVGTLPRRIIRSREPNNGTIAVADTSDTARSAHGQTPARCALPGCGLPRRTHILSSCVVRWQCVVQGSGQFFSPGWLAAVNNWPLQSYSIVAPGQERTCRDR